MQRISPVRLSIRHTQQEQSVSFSTWSSLGQNTIEKQHKEVQIWNHLSTLPISDCRKCTHQCSGTLMKLSCSFKPWPVCRHLQNKHHMIFLGLNIQKSCILKEEKPSSLLHQFCLLPKISGPHCHVLRPHLAQNTAKVGDCIDQD